MNPAPTKGCNIIQPTAKGRAIRSARLCVNSCGPRRKYSIAEKNPARMKNVGSVKTWTNLTMNSAALVVVLSWNVHTAEGLTV
jgi:hypothetical protein